MERFTFKGLMWGATLKVNLVRAAAAGIVWTVLLYASGAEVPVGLPGFWVYLFIWPIGYLFILPIAIVAGWLSSIGIPFAGLLTFLPAMMVIPGDPIVFFLHKASNNLVPVLSYKFFEPAFCVWVYEDTIYSSVHASETASDAASSAGYKDNISESVNSSPEKASCQYAGRIIIDQTTKVLGFDWPSKATAFLIKDDWSVETETDRKFGWIDVNGAIHRGLPLGGINPAATMAGGTTGFKVMGSALWANNDKIGDIISW